VAELADATVSNTVGGNPVRVQIPASAPLDGQGDGQGMAGQHAAYLTALAEQLEGDDPTS
jgi:hypothetical protein